MTTFLRKQWSVPTAASQPRGIVLSGLGICFTEFAGNNIGCMPVGGGTITEYPIPIRGSGVNELTLGPDGGLWASIANVSYLLEMH